MIPSDVPDAAVSEKSVQALLHIGEFMDYVSDPGSMLQLILEESIIVSGARGGYLCMFDKFGKEERCEEVADDADPHAIQNLKQALAEGSLQQRAIRARAPLLLSELGLQADGLACAVRKQDDVMGMLALLGKASGQFGSRDKAVISILMTQAAVTIENVRLYKQNIQNERLAAAGQAVTGIAHCVKNILNGLRGAVYIIDRKIARREFDDLETGWSMLKSNTEKISQLVLDMLDYAKDRRGPKARIDVRDPLAEVLKLLASKAAQESISLVDERGDVPAYVSGNDGELYRCFLNLVSNAIDATPAGGSIRVRTGPSERADELLVEVADTGKGIAPGDLEKLFLPFFSTKGKQGTGLGLAVTKKILDEHGAAIRVTSELGVGTRFVIHFPRHVAAG